MEYLNYLGSSGNKIKSLSKEMKSQFFSNMIDNTSNEYDELKYLILMREELFKYKLKIYYYYKWKNRALYNRDLIDEENPFINNNKSNYENFKKQNNINKDSIKLNNLKNSNNLLNNEDILNIKSVKESINILDYNDDLLAKRSKNNINNSKNELMELNDLLAKSNNNSINNSIHDSLKVFNIQQNINDALNKTNDLFIRINSQISGNINKKEEGKNYNNTIDNDNKEYFDDDQNIKNINENIKRNNSYNIFNSKNNEINNDNFDNNINNNNDNDNDNDNDNNENIFDINFDINNINKTNNLSDIIKKYKNLEKNLNKYNEKIEKNGLTNTKENNININNNENNININLIKDNTNYNNINKIENENKNNNNDINPNIKSYEKYDISGNIIIDKDEINDNTNNKNYYNNEKNNLINEVHYNNNNNNNNTNEINNDNRENIHFFSLDNINKIRLNDNNLENIKNNYFSGENNDDINNKIYKNIITNDNDYLKKQQNIPQNIHIKKNFNNKENKNKNKSKNNLINNKEKTNNFLKDIFKLKRDKSNKSNNIQKKKNNVNNKNKNMDKRNNYDNNKHKNSLNNNKMNIKENRNKPIDKLSKYYKLNNEQISDSNNYKKNKSLKNIHRYKKININKNSNIKKNNDKEKDNNMKSNKIKEYKRFDLKSLYRYPIKTNNIDEEKKEKYKNSKYLSTKYPNYLNTEENLSKSKSKSKSKVKSYSKKRKNYDNNLYNNNLFTEKDKDIQVALVVDQKSFNPIKSNENIPKVTIAPNNKLKNRDLSVDRIRDIKNISIKDSYSSNKNDFVTDSLLKHGFFGSKKKKKKTEHNELNLNIDESNYNNESNYNYNYDIEDIEAEKRYEQYNMKVQKLMEKYNQIKDKNISYDYIKKCKGSAAEIYGINNSQNNIILYNKSNKSNKSNLNYTKEYSNNKDFSHDKDYDSIFNSREKTKINITKNDNKSKYNYYKTTNNMSIKNILNNLDNNKDKNLINYGKYYGYDDLINNINKSQKNKIHKSERNSKTSRRVINKSISNKEKEFSNILSIDNNRNKSYVLAPTAALPITNISFRARLRYYSNKKEKELKKMMDKKIEEEKQIYTFHPKTDDNKLKVIKYNTYGNILGNLNRTQKLENKKKRKVDIKRINNLYLDYKDKQNKIDRITREYYKDAGFSFTPYVKDNNNEIKKFKYKIGQMPLLDRIEVYSHNKALNKIRKNNINNILYSTEI